MWHKLLGHLSFAEAESALEEHRLTAPGVYLEPGHLVQILQRRRRSAAQVTAPVLMCDLHDGYPITSAGRCDQCTRYPEDRASGIKPPTRHLGELALTVGRMTPEEA